MRKRCFIIGVIALVIGVFYQQDSYPDGLIIMYRKESNHGMDKSNETLRSLGRTSRIEYQDPYERNAESVTISRVSYALAGVLLLVGFIVGPEKKETQNPLLK
jgi:hypothetical protein